VTATISSSNADCQSNKLFSATFDGSFDPNDLSQFYLADSGVELNSATPISYSFVVQPGHTFFTLVSEVTGSPACPGFTLNLTSDRPFERVPPLVGGKPFTGNAATGLDFWALPPAPVISHQWRRCALDGTGCVDIAGATSTDYPVTDADVGHSLVLHSSATEGGFTSTADSLPVPAGIQIEEHTGASLGTGDPTIPNRLLRTGVVSRCSPEKGFPTISSAVGTWFYDSYSIATADSPTCGIVSVATPSLASCSGGTFSAAYSPAFAPAGGLGPGYVGDIGNAVGTTRRNYSFRVGAGAGFDVIATIGSPGQSCPYDLAIGAAGPYPTAAPAISAAPTEAQPVTTSDGTWTGSPAFAYDWRSCAVDGTDCNPIAGATGAAYTPTAADVGRRLRSRVTATVGAGTAMKQSALSDVVTAIPPPAWAGIPLAPATITVSRKGVAKVPLACPATSQGICDGKLSLKSARKLRSGKRGKARIVPLGSERFSIAKGATGRVAVKLPRSARALLKAKRRITAAATVLSHDGRGTDAPTTAPLTLKAPSRR
jgi:hypothetical protein